MSLITLKLTCEVPDIFLKVHKSVDYFNHLLGRSTNSQFYLETISNGLIYFFSSFEVLEAVTIPFSNIERKRLHAMGDHGLEFLFGDFFLNNPFPENGIIVKYEYAGSSIDQIRERLNAYFLSYECKNIQIAHVKPNRVDVIILGLDGMRLYANRLSQILEKYNTP
jgi:hypothetical protein